jgi:hypothetical protein
VFGEIPESKWRKSGVNAILNGINLTAGKYGELGGKKFAEAFGKHAAIKLFFMGAGSSGIGDAIDWGAGKIVNDDGHGFLMNYSIWTQAFFKDGGKTALLYLSPAYRKYKKNNFAPIFGNGATNMGMQYIFYLMGFSSNK